MRKIILVVATFITVAGIAFAASCYKYHYVLSVRCDHCRQHQTLEVDRDDDDSAKSYGRSNFSNHAKNCKDKRNLRNSMGVSITSKSKNDYEICD